jgi:hypothetical protein
MTPRPLFNALAASLYIIGIASFGFYAPHSLEQSVGVGMPILMLSLFTLSAALMAYLFFYEPLRLLLVGDAPKAMSFFLKTLASFAGITALILLTLFVTLAR